MIHLSRSLIHSFIHHHLPHLGCVGGTCPHLLCFKLPLHRVVKPLPEPHNWLDRPSGLLEAVIGQVVPALLVGTEAQEGQGTDRDRGRGVDCSHPVWKVGVVNLQGPRHL